MEAAEEETEAEARLNLAFAAAEAASPPSLRSRFAGFATCSKIYSLLSQAKLEVNTTKSSFLQLKHTSTTIYKPICFMELLFFVSTLQESTFGNFPTRPLRYPWMYQAGNRLQTANSASVPVLKYLLVSYTMASAAALVSSGNGSGHFSPVFDLIVCIFRC